MTDTDSMAQLDVEIKKLEKQKREEEIKQLKSGARLRWLAPTAVTALLPLIGGVGIWIVSEIKQYNEAYQALDELKTVKTDIEKLRLEKKALEREAREQRDSLNVELQTLIAQKNDYSREAEKQRAEKETLVEERTQLAKDVATLATEFRSLQYLRDALEATSIADSQATMTLMHVLRQSYEMDDEQAKHVTKKVLIVQTLGRVVFASSPKAKAAALDSWNLLNEYLREPSWFKGFLERHEEQLQVITGENATMRERRNSLLAISSDLRKAIRGTGSEQAFLKPIQPMKSRWFEQAETAAEKLTEAVKDSRPFNEVHLYCNQFWRMYCCELMLVEEAELAGAMYSFGELLKSWEESSNGIAPESVRDEIEVSFRSLQAAAKAEANL